MAKKGQGTDTIRDALILSMDDDSTKVRTNVIVELSDIRAAFPETFAALIHALEDSSKNVRSAAQKAIRRIKAAK